ncbi:TnsA endonuclease N-terminal domain-containing protein [Lonepinella sp. BR2919]|uniref:TnsA endonuclease N-terminal domain-containing protein n=1 Tax=unclassified Lonepinella TaxID=2642006 RepID=UPI003F6E33DB
MSTPVFQQVRKIKPTRLSVSGHLPFKNGVSLPYESTLERDLLIYFSYLSSVDEVVSQPVCVPFVKNGTTYTYTPDFFVRFNNEQKSMIIEVKPKSKWQKHWKDWREKWKAAMRFCKQNDCVFHVYDEDRIRHIALSNINFVQRYQRMNVEQEDIQAILAQVNSMECTTIDYLLSRFFSGSLYRTKGLQIIYHLLATKKLTCNWFEPLTESLEVWLFDNEYKGE